MIEGPEAFTRFREAAKKLLSTPKEAAPNPFGKRKKKKSTPQDSVVRSRMMRSNSRLPLQPSE